MTVRFHEGKGNVPLWAAITVIISILLATGGIVWGSLQREALRGTDVMKTTVEDHTNRILALEIDEAVLGSKMESVDKKQDQILAMLTTIGGKMGVGQ